MAGGDDLERMAAEIAGMREEIRLREELIASPPEPFLTTLEGEKMFRVSYETFRRRVADGKWPAMIIGRQARIGPEELAAIKESLTLPAPQPPMSSWERLQRNKRIRAMFPEKG
jgi:hypothetical protein